MDQYQLAQERVMLASYEVGRAQRELEEAEARFKKALDGLEAMENQPWSAVTNGERENG